MKKPYFLPIIAFLFAGVFAHFFSGTCTAEDLGNQTSSVFEIPEEKSRQWESVHKTVRQEYYVCLEHCGTDAGCANKCKNAYENGLEREYRQLMQKNNKKTRTRPEILYSDPTF